MPERMPTLYELVDAAGEPPDGVSVATQVIAQSDPKELIIAVRRSDSRIAITKMAMEQAPELERTTYQTILRIANLYWDDELEEGYEAQAAALQELASRYHENGIVPPAGVLDALFTAQEEAEKAVPADMEDSLIRPAQESLEESKEEVARLAEEGFGELDEEQELVREISRLRERFSRVRRAVAVGLVSLSLGIGAGSLVYATHKESYDSLRPVDRYGLSEPTPFDTETEIAAGVVSGIGAFATLAFSAASDSFMGRAARRKARQLVKKAKAAGI